MSLTDEQVIDRLRMALDEVAAAPIPETTNVVSLRRADHHAGRWLAVAAATVLVAGGVVALAMRGDGQQAPATTPTPTTPAPDTSGVPPTTQAPDDGTMPLAIVSPEFVGGEVVTVDRPGIGGIAMAWTRDTADGTAILILSTSPDASEPYVTGYGLTDAEIADLTAQLVPGSGLPYVLPVDGWQLAGFGDHLAGTWQEQLYTPAVTDPLSSYIPTVQLDIGGYRGQLEALPEGRVTPVTVNGDNGWRVDLADGTVVVWQLAGTGQWAQLIVAPELSDQVDALLAAIV